MGVRSTQTHLATQTPSHSPGHDMKLWTHVWQNTLQLHKITLHWTEQNCAVQQNTPHTDSTKQDFTKCLPEPQVVTRITPELLYTMSLNTPLSLREGQLWEHGCWWFKEDTSLNYPAQPCRNSHKETYSHRGESISY